MNSNHRQGQSPQEPDARRCLQDAIQFFHDRIDDPIEIWAVDEDQPQYDTAREYYHARGWTDSTIEEKQLGWAPPGPDLTIHLHEKGYSVETMLQTGLFWASDDGPQDTVPQPLWRGRLVFPYFDDQGTPAYAISRATGATGGGMYYDGHPDDYFEKYAKLAHRKEYVEFSEPIYGVQTIEPEQPLIITEGIADAISVHQAGYPCISPVTKQFKTKDIPELQALLSRYEIPRVYIIQDNEEPTPSPPEEPDKIQDVVPRQHGEGLAGALRTAGHLDDAYLVLPPRSIADQDNRDRWKVDLDDYIRTDGDLNALLYSAKPASEQYELPDIDTDEPTHESTTEASSPNANEIESDHALFDLTFSEVSGLGEGRHDTNPLGHHGDSRGYFHVNGDTAYDFKYKATYNALTYLLCELGLRDPAEPEGPLSPRELFEVWKHVTEQGYIDDQEIPYRALKHLALTEGFCDEAEIDDGWKLPPDAYNATLDLLAERGIPHNRSRLTGSVYTAPEECEPKTYSGEPFDPDSVRARLRGEKLDDFLDTPADVLWCHPPGTGKTVSAMLGLLDREESHAILFDNHRKIDQVLHEPIEDVELDGEFTTVCPDEHYTHLLGSDQYRYRECRRADWNDEPCPRHDDVCPHMCPTYDSDHAMHEVYTRIVEETGPMRAHQLLDLHEGEHCAWQRQLAQANDADYVMGVKGHETLTSITDDRVVVYDEGASLPADDANYSADVIAAMRDKLEQLSIVGSTVFATFATDVRDYLHGDREELPLPPLLDADDESIPGVLAVKEEYNEVVLAAMRNDQWDGTPLAFDALLAVAADGASNPEPWQRVIAAPVTGNTCPQCQHHESVDGEIGERECAYCGWREDLSRRARTTTTATGRALVVESLPPVQDLADDVLSLDATGHRDIHRGYFHRTAGIVGDIDFELDLEVIQFTDGQYHYGTVKGSGDYDGAADRIQRVIDAACDKHDRVLVVGHKKARQFYDLPGNARYIYFGGETRAMNFEEFDAVVVAGANHIPDDAARRQADLLATGLNLDPGGKEYSTRREAKGNARARKYYYQDADGVGREIKTKQYSGLTGTVFAQNREREIEQAVHRIRPLLHPGKTAYLVTNIPTELPVKELTSIDAFTRNPAEQQILEAGYDGGFTIDMVAEDFDVAESTVMNWTATLQDRNEIEKVTTGMDGKYWYDYT